MADINYPQLMDQALRGIMTRILRDVAESGLPGAHHFYITFNTSYPGVDLPAWMKDKFPDDMTIVIQEWFADLSVLDDRFAITLNFNNTPEPMVIPFDAVKSFVDPSVEFGLNFEGKTSGDTPDPEDKKAVPPVSEVPSDQNTGSVISLDKFRK